MFIPLCSLVSVIWLAVHIDGSGTWLHSVECVLEHRLDSLRFRLKKMSACMFCFYISPQFGDGSQICDGLVVRHIKATVSAIWGEL